MPITLHSVLTTLTLFSYTLGGGGGGWDHAAFVTVVTVLANPSHVGVYRPNVCLVNFYQGDDGWKKI